MDFDDLTPAERMSDEEYNNLIINKYGHIQSLAKTMLYLRKSKQKGPDENGEGGTKKRITKEDIAAYCGIIKDVDAARKGLNKLHMRLYYLQKEKALTNITFHEIRDVIQEASKLLSRAENTCISPSIKQDEIIIDFKND